MHFIGFDQVGLALRHLLFYCLDLALVLPDFGSKIYLQAEQQSPIFCNCQFWEASCEVVKKLSDCSKEKLYILIFLYVILIDFCTKFSECAGINYYQFEMFRFKIESAVVVVQFGLEYCIISYRLHESRIDTINYALL